MKEIKRRNSIFTLVTMLTVLFFLLSGCSTLKPRKKNTSANTKSSTTKQTSKKKDDGMVPLYLDFDDVLIPGELKVDKKSTFIYETSGLAAGLLALSGRVEFNSLVAFFENNMAKDNWRMVSSFKSTRTILLFQKENRYCVVYITDKDYKVYVELWVAPTMGVSESGLLK